MKKLLWIMLALCLFVMTGCGSSDQDVVTTQSPLVEIDNEYQYLRDVYTKSYQDDVQEQLDQLKEGQYTLQDPLVIANPYGTSTMGLYVYFTTENPSEITCTVSTEGYEDYQEILYNGEENNYATTHEYLLLGCVGGEDNTICLSAQDQDGKSAGSYTFTYQAPEPLHEFTTVRAEVTEGESKAPLANGLYTILGSDAFEDDAEGLQKVVSFYDNYGILRGEIPIISSRAQDFRMDEDGIYFSISPIKLVKMNRLGAITRIYTIDEYTLHHDYIFGSKDDLLVLGSDRSGLTKDDLVLSLDLKTGVVTQLIDLKKLLGDYYAMMEPPEGQTLIDWMHINSLDLIDGKDIVLSSRETSTIIYIADAYTDPSVQYLIGSESVWEGSGYEDLLLEQVGKFSLHAGQHSLLYVEDDSLEEGQYYLDMFNNNNTYSLQRKTYDWEEDSNYYDVGVKNDSKGNPSYLYRYLIDENAGTFSLVESVAVPYSGFVSSVQWMDNGNLVVDSGGALTATEYDPDGNLIQQMTFGGDKWLYRVKKFDFQNFWYYEDS